MDIVSFLKAVFSDDITNLVVILLFLAAFVNWVLGSLKAYSSGQFDPKLWDVFIRTDLAGRVLPLTIVMFFGRVIAVAAPAELVIPGLDLSIFTGAGILAAVPYLAGKLASILENVNPKIADSPPQE